MFAKPFIGIYAGCQSDRYAVGGFHDPLLPRWLDCISKAGGVPIIVPKLEDEGDLRCILDHLHGFIFAGQRDLDVESDESAIDDRDPDSRLVRLIAERQLPLLGIGVGMQLLNVAFGGSIGEINVDPTTATCHASPHNPRHALVTKPGSLIDRIYGRHCSLVASTHYAAIEQLAVGFSVTASCPDGIVEAIESESGDWFALGVQFCPEPDFIADLDLRIFEEFVEEVLAQEFGGR